MINQWDAIIVNYNGELFLDSCLKALSGGQIPPARIIVVDNASTDESIKELAAWPEVEVAQLPDNLGYAGGANRGVGMSDSPIAVILNPDVELDPDYGAALVRRFSNEERLGVAGAKLRFPGTNMLQHAGGQIHWPVLTTSHLGERQEDDGSFDAAIDVDYVTGAALAICREAFDTIGGFDERYFPAYWEDVDLSFRVRKAGWKVRYEPELTAMHHEGAGEARSNDYFLAWTRNRLRFAMDHLTSDQWWREFVPSEIERLRGELRAAQTPDWFVRSGGLSVELLARAGDDDSVTGSGVAQPEPLIRSIESISALPSLADPSPPPIQPSDGIARRLKRFLSRFSGRLYAEELYWQQRQFNESVVRAFEAQDRLNREMIVQMMFSMLLLGQSRADAKRGGEEHEGDPSDPESSLDW